MDAEDWKKKVGFPINYNSGQSSEDDLDSQDVVVRHPRETAYLLADGGDGAEADLLGTTPPRSRIRDKEKRRTIIDSGFSVNRTMKDNRRNTTDNFWLPDTKSPAVPERLKRRATLKLIRSKERDWKQDGGEPRSDSLPSPNPIAGVPTLVESCSRFMSLSSKLKCRMEEGEEEAREASGENPGEEDVVLRADLPPPSRLTFHQTFSMLINMGNMEKGCRRTISREEQVWQNELKDLIWLELQAKIAGRTLSQQDSYLCTQRNVVPTIIQKIIDYRFVNSNPCRGRNRLNVDADSNEDLTADDKRKSGGEIGDGMDGCMSINCVACVEAIGSAMREVGSLLDSFYSAVSLYPSSKAMTAEHPLIATQLFKNRLKAMCLWYNIALHMRLQLLAVRRMLISMQLKSKRREQHTAYDSDTSRQSSDSNRNTRVQFNVNSPSESSNSEYSSQSEGNKDDIPTRCSDNEHREEGERESEVESDRSVNKCRDDVDSGVDKSYDEIPTTPEILIDDLTPEVTLPDDSYLCNLSVSLRDVTRLRLLNTCQVSPYRNYHFEVLKTQGVRRCMMFINKTRKEILDKVLVTFQRVDNVEDNSTYEDERAEVFHDTKDEENNDDSGHEESQDHYELRRYGAWSPEGRSMCLPSYRAHFLLLTSICLEAVHDYLTMRLETQPDQPSCLTVKQLIHELKEGLDIASEMRLAFVRDVRAAAGGNAGRGGDLETVIKTFDSTVSDVVEQYHRYLCLMSGTERLGRACLEAEWAFAARIARRMPCAACRAPAAFTTVACNQLDLLLSRFKDKFQTIIDSKQDELENKHEVYALCRETQSVYASDKDAILHTVQWSRGLATRLARSTRTDYCQLRRDIVNHVMAIRDYIVSQTELMLDQSRITPDETTRELMDGVAARVRELILQVFRVGFDLHKELYKFAQAPFPQGVARRRPISLQPLRPSTIDRRRRPETMILNESVNPILMHRELYRFSNEPLARARRPVRTQRQRLLRNDSIDEDCETNVFDDRLFENGDQTTSVLDAMLPGAAHTAASACGEDECARTVALAIVQFARCWMTFVMERCDRGRGLRPRWANQGLEFLMLACDPHNTKHLSDEEFEELKQLMDGCISHVIGSRRPTPRAADGPAAANTHRHRLHSPLPAPAAAPAPPQRDAGPAAPPPRDASPAARPPTPPHADTHTHTYLPHTTLAHSARVLEATRRLDRERDEKLREMKAVGKVNVAAVESYTPKLRQLTFKWQRGLKIGAGTFGKVYTVVNTESGQLLAMKELSFGAGDRRALQRAANELRVLEGVIHAHLVRYYGCEVHREKLLLFMELCVEGSLEAALGAGPLDEPAARRYTRQLVAAVTELHARHIVHRDIKSGNIFLTNGGHCLKLGDFGCAVKIRANTTAAGELQGYVGTQAYMAPEVFMKSTGHGRAADIWSLGCVVTEMASGKRPFSEYDSNYQIMFVVGMGGRPEIPSTLSAEGQQFCSICLTHEPEARPKAEDLSMHHFLLVKSDDDCKCEPSFLI